MPTKHISDSTWAKVQKETYEAVISTGTVVKETDMLNYLIYKGISAMTADDYKAVAENRRIEKSQK